MQQVTIYKMKISGLADASKDRQMVVVKVEIIIVKSRKKCYIRKIIHK